MKHVYFLSLIALLLTEVTAETEIPQGIPTPPTLPAFGTGSQLYGALGFGSSSTQKLMWFVLDQSNGKSGKYDLLYIDLNANGDLTEDGESFTAPATNPFPMSDKASRFSVERFIDPVSGELHKDFKLSLKPEKSGGFRVAIEMMWNDARITKGPFAPTPAGTARLSPTLEAAPVFNPGFNHELEFEVWNPKVLNKVRETRFQVFIGHHGSTSGAFMCVDDTFLPEEEHLLATLIYKNESDQEKRYQVKLAERC